MQKLKLIGGTDHYDESGRQVGYSMEGIFGGQDHFDAAGHHEGYSVDGLFGMSSTYSDDDSDFFGGDDVPTDEY